MKMAKIFSLYFFAFTLMLNFLVSKAMPKDSCVILTEHSETISYERNSGTQAYPEYWETSSSEDDYQIFPFVPDSIEKCWVVRVPTNSTVVFKFETLNFSSTSTGCNGGYIKINEWIHDEVIKEITLCNGVDNQQPPSIVAFHDVMVKLYADENTLIGFVLHYKTEFSSCYSKEEFQCSDYFCIPNDKVCDGTKDCSDGSDEINCDNKIRSVEGIENNRLVASNWLERYSLTSRWKNNLHRTIVALYLSGTKKFSSKHYLFEDNLFAKQLELDMSLALLRNSTDPVSSNELSMFINAFLVTCRNPRQFYGFNLVQILKDSITYSDEMIQPVVYLALCNAHEPLQKNFIDQLLEVLDEDSEYLFQPELQAITIMTISCLLKNGQRDSFNETDIEIYEKSVKKLKLLHNEDGSFGNVYTTALITQALLSKGEDESKDWSVKASVKFLMKYVAKQDYLSTYYILPILNVKSLADISSVNCTESLQNAEENLISSLDYKLGSKMQVQYSLYLGTNKDVIHTIYLSVPEKTSAYEIMQLAALKDPKYKFQSKSLSGKIYVFEINEYINDPERGLFWLEYLESERFNDTVVHFKTSPDEIDLQENDHLIMWYRKP